MKLFHASRVAHNVGTTLLSKGEDTDFYRRAHADGKGGVEETLGAHRPDGAPDRRSCLYACGSLEHCQVYADGEPHDGDWHFYEVTMPNPWKAPMVLAGHLLRVGVRKAIASSIAREYWSPTVTWQYIEFMDVEMTIRAQADPIPTWPPPTSVDGARAGFQDDALAARQMFPADPD